MKRSLATFALALLATSALAADNAVIVTPGLGVTMRTVDVGALVQSPMVLLGSAAGAAIYGAAGSPPAGTNILTVQGIAAMTPLLVTLSGTNNINNISGTVSLPTGASTSALQPTTNAVAGTTTAGTTGTLAFGAVTTGSPTYVTANTNPLSLDTAGNLRVNVVAGGAGGGAVTVANGADVTQGNTADAVCSTDTGTCTLIALVKRNNVIVDAPLQAQAGTVIIGGVGLAAQTSGGCTPGRLIVAGASTNGTAIKAAAGTLCSVTIINQSTSAGQFRLQDATSATCNSATGVVANYPIQSNATSPGVTIALGPFGQAFSTGISFCFTGFASANVASDSDSTNFGGTTGNVVINYSFK